MFGTRLALLPLALALACGDSRREGFPELTEPVITTLPAASSGGSSSSGVGQNTSGGASASTAGGEGSSSEMKFDMSLPMPDGGAPPPLGCQGKIDFLFAVSAAGTMKDVQEQLIASFPGFIAAIKEQLPEFDVHILSAKAHDLWAIPDCSLCTDSCDPQGDEPLCGTTIAPCDKKIGAGVTFPVGTGASNRRCELHGGNRYIVSGEPNMPEMFDCIARVGLSGGDRVAEAMVKALDPVINEEGVLGCNAGFLRDDALLVVVLIADGFDMDSEGTPQKWINLLRAAKHGDDDAFTVLVLSTDADDASCEMLCPVNCIYPNKNRLRQLVEGVEHGSIASICAPDYTAFFTAAVTQIVELCESFEIPM